MTLYQGIASALGALALMLLAYALCRGGNDYDPRQWM